MIAHNWKLLRTKTDPLVDDVFDVATVNTTGLAAASRPAAANTSTGGPATTGVMVALVPIVSTSNRAQVARGAGVADMTLVVQVQRDNPASGGAAGVAAALLDSVVELAVPLCRMVYFPLNGATQFTIRVTNDVNYPGGSAALEVWWREVTV